MYADLRTRLFIALSLSCALSPAACKKDDGEATSVENEGKPKKKPLPPPDPKPEKTWILPGSADKPVACGFVHFCTTGRPKVAFNYDGGALHNECGGTVKVPEAALIEGFKEGLNASFIEFITKEQREKKDPAACCYGYETGPCGKGRPLRDGDQLVLAPEVRRTGWAGIDVAAAAREVEDVAEFVAYFRRVARLEHGSVAAFSAVSLELMALGAPADLVEAAHVAALDEIRHARVCWSLIEALTGEATGPGPMIVPERPPFDAAQILIATVIEGCVGETLGSLLFAESARHATPALAAIFATIADEEARHAELAFRIAKFIIGDDSRLAEVARAAALRAPREPSAGLLTLEQQRTVFERGFAEVVWPTLIALGGVRAAA